MLPERELTHEDYLSFMGPALELTFSRYFQGEQITQAVNMYREFNLPHHKDYVTIYPTVIDTLKSLKAKGYPLAVVTTKKKDAAYIGLDMFGLREYFDLVIGFEDVEHPKPSPEGIYKVMKNLSCHRGVMIGDNASDLQAGKNAHVDVIGVNWSPKGTKEALLLQPDLMIDRMDEIIKFIEKRG